MATGQIILTAASSGNVCAIVNAALLQGIIGYMASEAGAGAHLNSPLWKEVSRMRGNRGHERQSSVRMEAGVRLGMRSEEERLQTFHNWPRDAPVSPAELARVGFHYLGYGDTVQCFCCDGILRHWVHGDTPRGEHERHFPECGLMMGRDVGNVPLGSSDSVDGQLLSQLQRLTVDDQVLSGQAAYPEMESEDNRLSTYQNWPTGASVQPDSLARAGFFYTGASVAKRDVLGKETEMKCLVKMICLGLYVVSIHHHHRTKT